MSDDIQIRNSTPEDFGKVLTLLQQLWPTRELNPSALKASYLNSFELSGHFIRVAIYQNQVAGLCSLFIRNNLKAEGNLANVDELVVDETMRNKRIGKILLEDAERIAREQGCSFLGLESSFHREDAHRFYEEKGYWKQGYYMTKTLD